MLYIIQLDVEHYYIIKVSYIISDHSINSLHRKLTYAISHFDTTSYKTNKMYKINIMNRHKSTCIKQPHQPIIVFTAVNTIIKDFILCQITP